MLESMDSPWKYAADSPSRQLLRELSQLRIDEQRTFSQQLERVGRERDDEHREALAAAAARHEKVRQEAEQVRERALVEEQLQRELDYEQHVKELEKLKQEAAKKKLAIQKERIEATRAAEAAEKAAAEQEQAREQAEENARVARKKRQAEEARQAQQARENERIKTEAATKAKSDAESAARAKAQASFASRAVPAPVAPSAPSAFSAPRAPASSTPVAQPANSVPTTTTINPDREAEHRRYLQIHQNLKKLRKSMTEEGKRNPDLKKKMGDSRREIRKRVGQLTGENKENREPIRVVKDILLASLSTSTPSVSVLDYLYQPPSLPPNAPTTGPGLLLYLLNIFSKSLVQQFLSEASVSPKTADPVGIIGTTIFAQSEFHWNGTPLIDILLAKFHVKAPVLFGIFGPEATSQGKRRLGWAIEEGTFVSDQRHAEMMTGLGAGFAALTLRTFAKSKLSNPLPTWHFWRALAAVVNVPPAQVTVTHCIVLKAMVEFNVGRILEFFGDAGIAALRTAVVEFPARLPEGGGVKGHVAARSVALLKEIWGREEKLYL